MSDPALRFVGRDVLMATPEGWVSMGRLADDGAMADLLGDDEQVVADRWSTVDLTAPISVTFQAEPTAMRDVQLLCGYVATVVPDRRYL